MYLSRSSDAGIWQGVAWTMDWRQQKTKPVTLSRKDPDPDLMRRPVYWESWGAAAARTGLVRRELGARLQGSLLVAMEALHRTEGACHWN